MFHLAAWYQSVDPAGVYVQLAAPNDSQITVNTPRIQVPALNQILFVAGGAENVVAPLMRLVAPSVLTKARFQITPLSVATAGPVVPTSPHAVMDLSDNPLVLVPTEQLTCELLSNPAAVQIQWCGVAFGDGPRKPATGPIFTTRWTGATNLVAGAWTIVPLTCDDNLPRGRYQIVGMKAMSATVKFARVIVPAQAWRPGCLGTVTTDIVESYLFRQGYLGVWGEFEDIDNLAAEFLAGAADAAEVVFLDLLQLRAGPG